MAYETAYMARVLLSRGTVWEVLGGAGEVSLTSMLTLKSLEDAFNSVANKSQEEPYSFVISRETAELGIEKGILEEVTEDDGSKSLQFVPKVDSK